MYNHNSGYPQFTPTPSFPVYPKNTAPGIVLRSLNFTMLMLVFEAWFVLSVETISNSPKAKQLTGKYCASFLSHTAGMAYLGGPESALYRQPTPSGIARGHTTYVGLNPTVQQGPGFARPGGVTVYPPPSPQGYATASTGALSRVQQLSSNPEPVSMVPGEGAAPEAATGTGSDVQQPENATEMMTLANTKEKTPMCLINELARFNKVSHP